MFRPMRRKNQEISREDCKKILSEQKRAVLSVTGDNGYPYGVPVNYFYDQKDGNIYIHCAKEGHKIDAIKNSSKVCFTTWGEDYRSEGDWAWHLTSVIVMGKAELIDDIDIITDKVRKLALRYYPTSEEVEKEISESIKRVQLISIHTEHMTGKKIYEK